MQSKKLIDYLELEKHPEGGYYREVYRNPATVQTPDGGKRNLATSIYFLLEQGQKSHFHQLKSDELWYYHSGDSVVIHVFHQGEYYQEELGTELDSGQSFQVLLPAGSVFAAEVSKDGNYCLMGCMVNPGFDFKDFRLIPSKELIAEFPEQADLIKKFTE